MGFWRKDFTNEEIQHILGKLKPLRRISEDGAGVSISAGNFELYESLLVSALGMKARTATLRSDIVQQALLSPELPADFTENDFKSVAHRLHHKFLEDVRPHRVVFALWNIPPFLKGVRRKDDVTINFSPSPRTPLLKTVARAREEQRIQPCFRDHFTEKVKSDLQSCSMCIAKVAANSPSDAHERAVEALYETLGLINMANDGGKWRLSFSSRKLPVSEVLIGPHTTVHNADGSLTHNGFWYENWVGGPSLSQLPKDTLASWEAIFTRLVRGVSKSPWSELCSSEAARYFKAFSNPNLEESFLEGWRLFENISGARDDTTKVKLNRVSNVFRENIEQRIIGKHLELRRNFITHGHRISADDEESLAFQMLQLVHPYLIHFIMNHFSFARREEFWEFLDLPDSRSKRSGQAEELRRRLALLDKAARFRGET